MKIVVTAFAPFNGQNINFSAVVLDKLMAAKDVVKVLLPVEYVHSFTLLKEVIDDVNPALIILLGEARSYPSVGFEVIAINEYGTHADNVNFVPKTRFIQKCGPDGLFTTLDYDLFVQSFSAKKTAFHRSYSAGTYVCNALLYNTLYYLRESNLNIPCGFIHIPDFITQEVDSIVAALNNYLQKLSATQQKIK